MELPFPRHFSAGDQRQDLLGERNDDTASNSQDAVCALGRIVRFERQTDLQNAKAKQDQADRADQGKDKITQIVDTANGSPSAANAGTTKTASMKNTLAKME